MWQNLIKLFSFLVSLEGIFSRQLNFYNYIYWQIFWANVSQQMNVGIEEMNVRCKICCLGRIFETADRLQKIKRKSSKSRRESLRVATNRFYNPFSSKWKPCHGAINNRSRKLRMALEKYFRFHSNCKQLRIEAKNALSQVEICIPFFSETTHTILKKFSQRALM